MPEKSPHQRIVITGVGLTAPNANGLTQFRQALLTGKSGVTSLEMRYFGTAPAGLCDFDTGKYQKRRDVRNGTRAGSISIYCVGECLEDAALDWEQVDTSRVGVFLGITEHGNVETENEIHEISQYDYDTSFWSHHHNPRTVANSPAGEVTIRFGIQGPHCTVGAACAAGNLGLVQGAQQLLLDEVDYALAGGVSESPRTFGIFAAFQSQNALASHPDPTMASRPFDQARNGIVISEGGAVFLLERLDHALQRKARIYGELLGWCCNSDATDAVLPNQERQAQCIRKALEKAGLAPRQVSIVSTHATGTPAGDVKECMALRQVFGDDCPDTCFNNTKSFIGHCMGAAAALELAGNLPAFQDNLVHPTIHVENLDPQCTLPNLVVNEPRQQKETRVILNNSFGMMGINCVTIVGKYTPEDGR